MAADVALDSLHVVVAADVAYRVSFALRESLRISRAERADHECEFASRFRRVLVNWLLQSTLPGMVRHA